VQPYTDTDSETMKKLILFTVVVALALGGTVLFQRAQQARLETPLPQPAVWRVWTVQPQQREVRQSASFLARLDSVNSASLASKLSGQISRIAVAESQAVKAGDLLVEIDDSEVRSSIDGLKATLASARAQKAYSGKQLQRNRELFKTQGISRDRLESSEAAFASASAQVLELEQKLRGLENQLRYSRITAPFDAVVGSILMREGDLAVPGKPILSLNALGQKLTFSFLPGAAVIRPGQEVWVGGKRLGRVSILYNDARAGLWVAEARLDERLDQPVGSYLNIDVVTRSGQGCAVPLSALVHRREHASVMRYAGDRFVELPVVVKAEGRDYALIEPCVDDPVAVAAESKLVLLPAAGPNVLIRGAGDE